MKNYWTRSSATVNQRILSNVTGWFLATKCKNHCLFFFLAKEEPCGGHIIHTSIPRGSLPSLWSIWHSNIIFYALQGFSAWSSLRPDNRLCVSANYGEFFTYMAFWKLAEWDEWFNSQFTFQTKKSLQFFLPLWKLLIWTVSTISVLSLHACSKWLCYKLLRIYPSFCKVVISGNRRTPKAHLRVCSWSWHLN